MVESFPGDDAEALLDAFFSPELLTPTQFHERRNKLAPEQRLVCAVFRLALLDARYPRYRAAIRDWALDGPAPLRFEVCCQALGFEPDAVRARLLKILAVTGGQRDDPAHQSDEATERHPTKDAA
jgi:hypothetical protein